MASSSRKPVIGITMGDPAGIGPEVVVKALADPAVARLARFVVFGMNELMTYAADLAELELLWHRLQHDSPRAAYSLVHDAVVLDYDEYGFLTQQSGQASRQGGQASLQFLDDAVAAANRPVEDGGVDAVVTAPICKESWRLAGCRFPGHTEFLQHRTKAKRVTMLFHAPPAPTDTGQGRDPGSGPVLGHALNVTLATIHIPLMDIRNRLTVGAVFDPIDLGHQACIDLGIDRPRVAVCGLNPHASENGLFGDEERRVIEPAIEVAHRHGMNVVGPMPADTVFVDALAGRYDLVVAMYHDQGLIPIKLLAFDRAVNVTLGLPIIRTSPDHGTAFGIAGQNRADAGSMKSAIRLAARLARQRIEQADRRQSDEGEGRARRAG